MIHSGSAKAKIQCWVILTTSQATSITLATMVGLYVLLDLDFANVYMAWPTWVFFCSDNLITGTWFNTQWGCRVNWCEPGHLQSKRTTCSLKMTNILLCSWMNTGLLFSVLIFIPWSCVVATWLESKTEQKVMAHFAPASPNGLRTGKAQNKLTMGGGFISLKWNKNDLVSMLIGCVLFVF